LFGRIANQANMIAKLDRACWCWGRVIRETGITAE
jgi:hypothetical protein